MCRLNGEHSWKNSTIRNKSLERVCVFVCLGDLRCNRDVESIVCRCGQPPREKRWGWREHLF